MAAQHDTPRTITLLAMECVNLDTTCYRGSAPASELARISTADVFDQVSNPEGLQRDLNRRHAAEAYDYVTRDKEDGKPRAFPEVLLNVRDKTIVDVEKLPVGQQVPARMVRLTFDLERLERAKTTKVSRMDGNHRLHYAAGDGDQRGPVDALVPFSITLGLTREEEGSLFLDVNAEQKGLNTSHLSFLRSRLTPEERELQKHPERAYARRLAEDAASPWHGMVHLGGSKSGLKQQGAARPVTFTALVTAVQRTLRKSQYMQELTPRPRYELLRRYWQAVASVWEAEWAEPREYLLVKGIGAQAMAILGATVIDRCQAHGDVEQHHMEWMLQAVHGVIDFHRGSDDVSGMSGNRAALLLAGRMLEELPKHPQDALARREDAA